MAKVRVERSFLGLNANGTVIRLPEGAILAVACEEDPEGFVEVLAEGRTLRVLAIDLALRTVRVTSAEVD